MDGTERLALEGACGLDRVEALQDELATALATAPRVEVGTAGLAEAPLALVQTLYAAHLGAAAAGRALLVDCPADGPLAAALARMGFDRAAPSAPLIEDGRWTGLAPA